MPLTLDDVAVEHDDLRALLGEGGRRRGADARGAAGDDRDAPRQRLLRRRAELGLLERPVLDVEDVGLGDALVGAEPLGIGHHLDRGLGEVGRDLGVLRRVADAEQAEPRHQHDARHRDRARSCSASAARCGARNRRDSRRRTCRAPPWRPSRTRRACPLPAPARSAARPWCGSRGRASPAPAGCSGRSPCRRHRRGSPGLVRNSNTKRCAASRPPSLAGSEISPRRIGATSAAAAIFAGQRHAGEDLARRLGQPLLGQRHQVDHAHIGLFGRGAHREDAVLQQDQPLDVGIGARRPRCVFLASAKPGMT